jgi:SAM-dependent methyltransferase
MTEWFNKFDETLWLQSDAQGEEESRFIAKALRLKAGKKVLDAPCGAGRIAVHLAKRGCSLTGIDLRESFARRARERFAKEKTKGRFTALDLRDLDFKNEFHAAYSWLGSFGYFSENENILVLRNYVRALLPGGLLLIDQPNREGLLRHFRKRINRDGITIANRWDPRSERMHSVWITHRNGKNRRNPMSMRLYTPSQMETLFQRAGLCVEAIYGNFRGDAYTRTSRRLILVGRKGNEKAFNKAACR